MTKIEGIQSMVKSIFGKDAIVKSTDCGQRYWIKGRGLIYVDTLRGGRVSIKIKYFTTFDNACKVAKAMWNWFYDSFGITVDAKAIVDVYETLCFRAEGTAYGVRLRCDKWW